jgi:hypothetical protein
LAGLSVAEGPERIRAGLQVKDLHRTLHTADVLTDIATLVTTAVQVHCILPVTANALTDSSQVIQGMSSVIQQHPANQTVALSRDPWTRPQERLHTRIQVIRHDQQAFQAEVIVYSRAPSTLGVIHSIRQQRSAAAEIDPADMFVESVADRMLVER